MVAKNTTAEPVSAELPRLPKSGTPYEVREGRGHDLLKAQKMSKNDPNLLSYGLIAVLVKVAGKAITLEEVLDMPLDDVGALMAAVNGATGNE